MSDCLAGLGYQAAFKRRSASSLRKIQPFAYENTLAGTRTLRPWIFLVSRISPFPKQPEHWYLFTVMPDEPA